VFRNKLRFRLAAALGAKREHYFDCLAQWRSGNALPIIELFVTGFEAASLGSYHGRPDRNLA
jgi:hypothetical protein